MTEQEIEKLVQDKLNEAYQENVPPKKFFLTENGRGVVDGGGFEGGELDRHYQASAGAVSPLAYSAVAQIEGPVNGKRLA